MTTKPTTPYKMGRGVEQTLPQRRHMKKYSAPLITGETQIQIAMRCHFWPVGMIKIKRLETTRVGGDALRERNCWWNVF